MWMPVIKIRAICASGSVRQLNNAVTAARSVYFYAFTLVRADGVDFANSVFSRWNG